jgi:hypothetical protein
MIELNRGSTKQYSFGQQHVVALVSIPGQSIPMIGIGAVHTSGHVLAAERRADGHGQRLPAAANCS